MKRKLGFTLIELMVVMGIMGLLAALLFALIGGADSKNDELKMNLLISSLFSAQEQFENLTGDVALPTGDRSNPNSGRWYPSSVTGAWGKQQLYWRLGTEMTQAHRIAGETNAQTADETADPYQNRGWLKQKHGVSSDCGVIPHQEAALDTITDAEADEYKGNYTGTDWAESNPAHAHCGTDGDVRTMWNQLTKRGEAKFKLLKMRGKIARNLGLRTYQTMNMIDPAELGTEYFDGDTIVDLWGNPLIYIAHSTVGVEFQKIWTWGGEAALRIGANPGGREEVDDRNNDGIVDDKDWIVEPTANKKGDWDGSGAIDVNDWDNMLFNARPTRGRSAYIASAGEDGLFNCLRTQDVNKDNIENTVQD